MDNHAAPKFTFIDLFAGVGGFHHALSDPRFGGECVFAADIDAACREVYASSFPSMDPARIVGDIRTITLDSDGNDRSDDEIDRLIPDHDVLCGGFPCQPFSLAGKQLGEQDPTRGTLFHDIITIVRVKRPSFVLLENVKNLISKNHTHTWETIVAALRGEGYVVPDAPVVLSPHMIDPNQGGRPQNRERVFITAVRDDLTTAPPQIGVPASGDYPMWNIEDWLLADDQIADVDTYRLTGRETVWIEAWNELIRALPHDDLPGTLWVEALTSELPPDIDAMAGWRAHILRSNRDLYLAHTAVIDKWLAADRGPGVGTCTVRDFPPSRQRLEWQARSAQPTAASRNLWKLAMQFRQSGIRVKPATHLPALVALTQTSIIGSRRRRITPVEAGRLQGLPDGVFAGVADKVAYKQAGNGVNVGAVQYVAAQLFDHAGRAWGQLPTVAAA